MRRPSAPSCPTTSMAWRAARVPLCTYETQQPLAQFSCLAFSVSYELELAGIFEMLDLAGIPLLARGARRAAPAGGVRADP